MRAALSTFCVLAAAGTVAADPFLLRYEADAFPEDAGWSRQSGGPTAELVRDIDAGVFRLDSRASSAIFDFYRLRVDALDLSPGESLRLTWRMRTLETTGSPGRSDVALAVTNGQTAYALFFLAPDLVSEDEILGGPLEHEFELTPGAWHTFELRSADLRAYTLQVNGAAAFEGAFHDSALLGPLEVAFGDVVSGRASLSEWDFVEIAVVPEPGPALGLVLAIVCDRLWRRAKRCACRSTPRWSRRCSRAPP